MLKTKAGDKPPDDVMERRNQQQDVRVTEKHYRTLFEMSADAIFLVKDGTFVDCNQATMKMFGCAREQIVGRMPHHFSPEFQPNGRLSKIMAMEKIEAAYGGEPKFFEWQFIRNDGTEFYAEVSLKKLELGGYSHLLATVRDISERKRNQEVLHDSEIRIRSIIEQSPIAISFTRDGYIVDGNAALLEMFRYTDIDEVKGKPLINQIAPQCRAEMEDRIRRRSQLETVETNYETIGLRKDGSQFPLYVATRRLIYKDGPMSTSFLVDFTERDKMRKSIERINKLYKMLSDINSANILIRERGKLFETACRIAVESGVFRMAWIGLLDRDSGAVVPVAQAGHVDGYLDNFDVNIYDEITGNGPTGRAIKTGSSVACADIIGDPRMAPWRDEALKRGYRASLVSPLKQSDQIIGAFCLYLNEVGALNSDVIQLLDNLAEDISFTLDFIDESSRRERVQNELRELTIFQQSALESERKRIARELHDELGQTMTALNFDLKWLHENIDTQEHELQNRLHSMQSLLGRTVDTVRRISEDLRPGMLDDLGLAAAIEHHVEKFSVQTGIACDLSINPSELDLEDQIATSLFRILQESLTNVARHSGASRVVIDLREIGENILLIVQDNGRGLPSNRDPGKKTYGLLGMRERVKILEGTLDIFNEAGAGARIEACVPKYATAHVKQ